MNRAQVVTFLHDLFDDASLAESVVEQALTRSRTLDADQRPPTHPEWTETHDEWLAAAEVAELNHLKEQIGGPALKSFTSEGTTFNYGDATDWLALAARLRARSPLMTGTGNGWAMVPIPSEATPFHPRSEEVGTW